MKMRKGRLIVLSGPSGVGKGTVLASYLKAHPEVKLSVSATTRAPRPGEEDGVHYHFLSRDAFAQKIEENGMLEWAAYNNNYYGTPRAQVEKALDAGSDVVLEIEVQGAFQVRAAWPDAILIFVMPPDFDTLQKRLADRGTEDAQTVQRRLREAVREISRADQYDYMVVNDTVDHAAHVLEAVIEGARHRVRENKAFIMEVCKDAQAYLVTD